MNTGICNSCMNKGICGEKGKPECGHYDVALTRSEVLNILNNYKLNNPSIVPAILGAVKKTYKINLAY
jgi:hypothetical protein